MVLFRKSGGVMPINRQDKEELDLEGNGGLCWRKWEVSLSSRKGLGQKWEVGGEGSIS